MRLVRTNAHPRNRMAQEVFQLPGGSKVALCHHRHVQFVVGMKKDVRRRLEIRPTRFKKSDVAPWYQVQLPT